MLFYIIKMLTELVLFTLLVVLSGMWLGGSDSYLSRAVVLAVIIYGAYLRYVSTAHLYSGLELSRSTVILTFVSHVGIFILAYIYLQDRFDTSNPTNAFLDGIMYSLDTVTTYGDGGVVATDSVGKSVHAINLIDTYLLLASFGYYFFQMGSQR